MADGSGTLPVSDDAAARAALERALDYRFVRGEFADTALSHPSYAHELDGSRGNERLEFLGDAVLDLVVARVLYEARPDWREGQLTRARAALVKKTSLAERARSLGLPDLVKLGKTELITAAERGRPLLIWSLAHIKYASIYIKRNVYFLVHFIIGRKETTLRFEKIPMLYSRLLYVYCTQCTVVTVVNYTTTV